MVKITYVESSGNEHVLDITTGLSVMQGAVANNVRGIIADPQPTSRLSCQITVTGELDGLVVRMPAKQV
jgi:ferredoxin, 2Fe-2S